MKWQHKDHLKRIILVPVRQSFPFLGQKEKVSRTLGRMIGCCYLSVGIRPCGLWLISELVLRFSWTSWWTLCPSHSDTANATHFHIVLWSFYFVYEILVQWLPSMCIFTWTYTYSDKTSVSGDDYNGTFLVFEEIKKMFLHIQEKCWEWLLFKK